MTSDKREMFFQNWTNTVNKGIFAPKKKKLYKSGDFKVTHQAPM